MPIRYLFGTNEDAPQFPSGLASDTSGLYYGPTPSSSIVKSAVRYLTGGSDDYAAPPLFIQEDYWIDPQKDVERYVVTVPLPWSWEPSDSIVAFLTVVDEDGDLTRPIPWKRWVAPKPWTFDGLYRASPPAAVAHGPLSIQLAASHLTVSLTASEGIVSLTPSILIFPLSSSEE